MTTAELANLGRALARVGAFAGHAQLRARRAQLEAAAAAPAPSSPPRLALVP